MTYFQWGIDFKARLNQALQTWLGSVGYAAGLLLLSLQDKADQWWYFLEDPHVPPDNNLAERSFPFPQPEFLLFILKSLIGYDTNHHHKKHFYHNHDKDVLSFVFESVLLASLAIASVKLDAQFLH
jgi:hypothetical protein